MKKLFIFLFILFLLPHNVFANEKIKVSFSSCVDGDTAYFILNNEKTKVRFLAINTPELSSSDENEKYYANKAKEFTCNKLKNAKKIILEFDKNSNKTDKYGRYLAWVFYDDNLLQSKLVRKGYAEIDYVYGNYSYTDKLIKDEMYAKSKKLGMYSDDNMISKDIKNTISKYIDSLLADVSKFFSKILDEIF